jgi:hypothetical protein
MLNYSSSNLWKAHSRHLLCSLFIVLNGCSTNYVSPVDAAEQLVTQKLIHSFQWDTASKVLQKVCLVMGTQLLFDITFKVSTPTCDTCFSLANWGGGVLGKKL